MGWVPDSAWLTKLEVKSSAADLRYDLAVDTTGAKSPSRVAAGLELPSIPFNGDIPTALFSAGGTEDGSGRSAAFWAAIAAAVLIVMATVGMSLRLAQDRER